MDDSSNFLPKKTYLRLLTANCCSIREYKSEFTAALDYVKLDLICGTESWLKGVKPGKEPAKMQSRPVKFFQMTLLYTDRMSRGCWVFTGVRKNLIADEQTQLITDCDNE